MQPTDITEHLRSPNPCRCQRSHNQLHTRFMGWKVEIFVDLPPSKFNSSPLKNDGWKTTFLLGRPIFRGNVKLRGGIWRDVLVHLAGWRVMACSQLFFVDGSWTHLCLHIFGQTMLVQRTPCKCASLRFQRK